MLKERAEKLENIGFQWNDRCNIHFFENESDRLERSAKADKISSTETDHEIEKQGINKLFVIFKKLGWTTLTKVSSLTEFSFTLSPPSTTGPAHGTKKDCFVTIAEVLTFINSNEELKQNSEMMNAVESFNILKKEKKAQNEGIECENLDQGDTNMTKKSITNDITQKEVKRDNAYHLAKN